MGSASVLPMGTGAPDDTKCSSMNVAVATLLSAAEPSPTRTTSNDSMQLPAPSQVRPLLSAHDLPCAALVVIAVPPMHVVVAQSLLGPGFSLSSAMSWLPPEPSQTFCLQSNEL